MKQSSKRQRLVSVGVEPELGSRALTMALFLACCGDGSV
jgi:hypothetical protein